MLESVKTESDGPQVLALIGEEGTHKSRLGRAFLASGIASGGRGLLFTFGDIQRLENRINEQITHYYKSDEEGGTAGPVVSIFPPFECVMDAGPTTTKKPECFYANNLVHRRLSAQGMSGERFIHVILTSVLESLRGQLEASPFHCIEDAEQLRSDLTYPNGTSKEQLKWLKAWLTNSFPSKPVPWAYKIRVVIDDLSQFTAGYPDLEHNKSVIPYMIDVLRRIGCQVLIIDTQSGNPLEVIRSERDKELRSYVQSCIHTWNIRLGGQARVALTVHPTFHDRQRSYVRELLGVEDGNDALTVDRHLELYSLVDEGEPKLTSIRAFLFDECVATSTYLDDADSMIRASTGHLFTQKSVVTRDYSPDQLRDELSVRPKTLSLDETIITQVDNWWFPLDPQAKGWDGGGEFLPIRQVIPTAWDEDKFDKSVCPGVDSDPAFGSPELIPYIWNFGFLLLRHQTWLRTRVSDLIPLKLFHAVNQESPIWLFGIGAVLAVSSRLKAAKHDPAVTHLELPKRRYGLDSRLPWSHFFAACRLVREFEQSKRRDPQPLSAFRFSAPSGESLNCLVLEIWCSLFEELQGGYSDAELRSSATWLANSGKHSDERPLEPAKAQFLLGSLEEAYSRVLKDKTTIDNRIDLLSLLEDKGIYGVLNSSTPVAELAKAALLLTIHYLAEHVAWPDILSGDNDSENDAHPSGESIVAERHWYSSAVAATQDFNASDPQVPFMLPGSYSVRGDWYLAALKESRSEWMAALSITALTSTRASIDRMKSGVGLPVRKVSEEPTDSKKGFARGIRTAIPRSVEGRSGYVYYQELLDIAPLSRDPNAHSTVRPIWRGKIKGYRASARVFRRFILRTVIDISQVMESRSSHWVSAIDAQPWIEESYRNNLENFTLEGVRLPSPATLKRSMNSGESPPTTTIGKFESYVAWFNPLLQHLLEDLKNIETKPKTTTDDTSAAE